MAMIPLALTASVACALPSMARGADLALEEAIHLEPQSVAQGTPAELPLPPLAAEPGRAILLRFRAVILSPAEGGCNLNASVRLNGMALGRRTADGGERLVGRDVTVELAAGGYPPFPVFSGDRLMIMYAPDADRGDAMTTDGLGATFVLDVSDVARADGPNTLSFRNEFPGQMEPGFGVLRVEAIEVGWLDRAQLPAPPNNVPERGPVATSVTRDGWRLAQSTRGGFAVRVGEGPELLVESTMGGAPTALAADDSAPGLDGVRVATEPWGEAGFRMTALWEGLSLSRTVSLRQGRMEWKERWTNTSDTIRGVPFRHRLFLRGEPAAMWVGGSADSVVLDTSACNPTLFLESRGSRGNGWGVTAESDWLRLLLALRGHGGVGELFTETLALAPGSSVDLDLTLSPVTDAGGYWSFINGVRDRWGVSGITQKRPIFWGYARPAGAASEEDAVREALANLGPVTVVLGPWQRLEPDTWIVRPGAYPKLPADAPRAPGACPDLDVDAFLTFAHREEAWAQLKRQVELIRRVAPNVAVMQMLHPSMEVVYRPLQDRWPYASEAILTPDGKPFESDTYSHAWLGDWTDKDWGVFYYAPHPGSVYLETILEGVTRGLEEVGLDGIYCDEFSWAFTRRGYSRYDYSRWDGYSADLDAEGKVVRLKADNAFVAESCQLRLVGEALRRDRFFLGNGGNALRSLNRLPHARFIEGGGGAAQWPQGHLSPTPLVLGNMGDEKTRQGVFESVKACLQQGCLYSPTAVNLLLEGPDNFVSKLYPMTVRELGPGWIVGEERMVTTVSRRFAWPGEGMTLRLFRYYATGQLLEAPGAVQAGPDGSLMIEVPEGGMVVAER